MLSQISAFLWRKYVNQNKYAGKQNTIHILGIETIAIVHSIEYGWKVILDKEIIRNDLQATHLISERQQTANT